MTQSNWKMPTLYVEDNRKILTTSHNYGEDMKIKNYKSFKKIYQN